MPGLSSSAIPATLLTEARPILKWAGGKSQLLAQLRPLIPNSFGQYIEPFIGGGALYFNLNPARAVIADSNPELVNLYQQVASNVNAVIRSLSRFDNEEEVFYLERAKDWKALSPHAAAARTLFLNKTCFNGLYRVNRKGEFNTPFGRYKNPNICDVDTLLSASAVLSRATIECGDYKSVLQRHAAPGDVVFLDPPYLPVGKFSDFKRYTAEQFYEEDHREMAQEVTRLHELGCHVLLTNSNHPLVHELFGRFDIKVVSSRRYISSNALSRTGEDLIVNIPPSRRITLRSVPVSLPSQVAKYPSTRFMGAKSKLLTQIWDVASQFKFDTALDLFSGSGVVGYMLKAQGKRVISNDYMAMSHVFAKATIENSSVHLPEATAIMLLKPTKRSDCFVQDTFRDLYYSDDDNILIDNIRANIKDLKNANERAIGMSALIRACIKKRPRGIFTYVGQRYDDGRKDLQRSMADHFLEAVKVYNEAVFSNGTECVARNGDALDTKHKADFVYMDPPYYSPLSDNEYVRRYHFVEGLARDWEGVEIQAHTQTKKFKSYPTPFASRKGATEAFDLLFRKFKDSILLVSYSSNSLPTLDEMVELMSKHKRSVEVISVDYKYSFGNQGTKIGDNKNSAKEYLFIGYS